MGLGFRGSQVKAAYARCNTWGVPASVTQQLLLTSTDGMDTEPQLVDEDSFNQNFLAEAEVGEHTPRTPEVEMILRYEQHDVLLAGAMGSPAAPVVVSSAGANSLVAYSHVIDLVDNLEVYFTLAADLGRYVLEIPSLKTRGYSLRVGENGRMMIAFPIVGAKTVYDSTTNTNSTVAAAAAATFLHRVFRKTGRIRMNLASAGALGATDEATPYRAPISDFAFNAGRPVADGDYVFGQDYIIAPDDNGFPEFTVDVTYPRMSTVAANSLAFGIQAGTAFKADVFFEGTYINSLTKRSLLWEFPALQLYSFAAVAASAEQVRPTATFRAKRAGAAPTGMAGLTNPFRLTIVNANSATLL
jgi:hypothetical protein